MLLYLGTAVEGIVALAPPSHRHAPHSWVYPTSPGLAKIPTQNFFRRSQRNIPPVCSAVKTPSVPSFGAVSSSAATRIPHAAGNSFSTNQGTFQALSFPSFRFPAPFGPFAATGPHHIPVAMMVWAHFPACRPIKLPSRCHHLHSVTVTGIAHHSIIN